MIVYVAIFTAGVSYLMWAYLHELSHYAALKLLRKDAEARFFPYPHVHDERFFWARIEWTFAKPELSDTETTIVYWAPRLTDFIGAVVFVILAHVSFSYWAFVALILCGGSVVDAVVGSIGHGLNSDLKRVSRALQISPWYLRVVGFVFSTLTAVFAAHGIVQWTDLTTR